MSRGDRLPGDNPRLRDARGRLLPGSAEPVETRFWRKVNKGNSCWEWNSTLDTWGYGCFWPESTHRKSKGPVGAHRFSWRMHNGDIPDGLLVLHKCDNPKCVNPDHLFLGTHKDNSLDMTRKERGRAKLTGSEVLRIRTTDTSAVNLAMTLGVSRATIRDIRSGRTWRHLPAMEVSIGH